MLRLTLGVLVLAIALSPNVWAGTVEDPEMTDLAGDARTDRLEEAGTGQPPWAEASDILAAWLTDDEAGLHATIHVADLSAIATTDAGANQDTMFFVRWQPSYNHTNDVLNRTGEWELRAEYRPQDPSAWHFWMERPCKDGDDSDGCSGEDRDIIQGLEGSVDLEASTVTITAPWWHLEHPEPGDGIFGLVASSQMVWPSWPVYTVDWDHDERDTCYRFTSLPLEPSQLEGSDRGPTGAAHGSSGAPYDPAIEDACAREANLSQMASANEEASGARSDGTDQDTSRDSPLVPGVLVVLALVAAGVLRRA